MIAEPIGQQFGDYQVLRALGQGGQACVYLGQHVRLQQRMAAVKLLRAQLSLDDIAGFQHEAETIAHLQHPQIVNILDFNVKEGVPFIIMEYYPSGTLRERHPRGEQVLLETVVTYVQQGARALQYAHDHRVIHRDVKAANMLIGYRDAIVLTDFGIAASAYSTSSMCMQSLAGTIAYMAPEQIKGFPRRESDQYALAIVAYEWLTGESPFSGTPEEIAIKHLTVEPPSLLDRLPHLPAGVEQVIFKALAKEPKERFPCILDFALALSDVFQAQWPPLPPSWAHLAQEGAFKPAEPLGRTPAQGSSNERERAPDKSLTGLQMPSSAIHPASGTCRPVSRERKAETTSKEQEPAASSEASEDGVSAEAGSGARPSPAPRMEPVETRPASVSARPLILPSPSQEFSSAPSTSFPAGYSATDTLPISPTARFHLVKEGPLSLNGKEIMRKIGRQDTPTSWHVLLPSPRKLALMSLWRGLDVALFSALNTFLLLWALTVLSPSEYLSLSSSFPVEQLWAILQPWGQKSTTGFFTLFLLGPTLIALVLGCLAALRYRITHGQRILVLLPEGLVYGKRSQQKRLQVINYREVAGLRAKWTQVGVQLFKKNGQTRQARLDLSLFPSSRILALTIKASYERYKKEHG